MYTIYNFILFVSMSVQWTMSLMCKIEFGKLYFKKISNAIAKQIAF